MRNDFQRIRWKQSLRIGKEFFQITVKTNLGHDRVKALFQSLNHLRANGFRSKNRAVPITFLNLCGMGEDDLFYAGGNGEMKHFFEALRTRQRDDQGQRKRLRRRCGELSGLQNGTSFFQLKQS